MAETKIENTEVKGILEYNKVYQRFNASSRRREWAKYLKKLIAKNFPERMKDSPTNSNQDK